MSKVGIDFDDVLVKTAQKVVDVYNGLYETQLTIDDWYDLSPQGLVRYKANEPADVVKRVMAFQGKDDFVVEPVDGAVEALHALRDAGHELVIITGRPESLRQPTLKNIREYFSDLFTSEDVYFVDHFSHDGEERRIDKGDVARELGLDFFIDDVVSHADIVAKTGVKTMLLDMGYKWSKQPVDATVLRVSNWEEIVQEIDG